jgi:predicted NUDIX family NTP pyrophosphohydrolase
LPRKSAGVLLYRRSGQALEVLLAHPGGPYWHHRDDGAWMIPKGAVEPGEEPAAAALREFQEEMGILLAGTPEHLCTIRQAGGKYVEAYALEAEFDADMIVSNHVSMEYPAKSGRMLSYPEMDRAAWFDMPSARAKMLPSQLPILDALEERLRAG